jgi:hypothetical protein
MRQLQHGSDAVGIPRDPWCAGCGRLRIPSDADQRSEVMAIAIPN